VALRRRALRAFDRCICARHAKAAREARHEAHLIILKAKKDSWEKFSNTFNRFTPLSKIWSLIKCFTNKRNSSYKILHLIIKNQHFSTPTDVATQFAAHYHRVSAHDQYTEQLHTTLNTTLATCHFQSDNTEDYNHLFTLYELQLAISKSGTTSVGPDQLAYAFFKNLTESGLVNFLSGLNQLWVDGTFPETWSHSTLIPLLKSRKPPSDPASYRPISLASCASKIFERMVNQRLRTYLESNQILSPHQNGFRPGHSTADSLIHLIDSAQRGFHNKYVTVALFLDLKAAFDKVHHSTLLIKLHKVGVRGRLATFIQNFINQRTFSVRCGNTSSGPSAQQHGVPQGCVLSPTLFLIVINDVFNDIYSISQQFKFSIYADDLAVWFTHPSIDRANHFIQLALNHINDWCCRWGLQISPAKSASMAFSNQFKHLEPVTPLNLDGQNIPFVTTFKYLGITLDRRLTFTAHIADIKQRCSRRLNILKCIAGREWGSDRRTLLHLYTALIRSILDYNAFLFDHISKTNAKHLEAIQNSALRIATGAFRTTPTYNLNIDTNIPTLEQRRKYLLLRFYVKARSRPNNPALYVLEHLPSNRNYTKLQKQNPTISMRIKQVLNNFNITIPTIAPAPSLTPFWTYSPINTNLLFSMAKTDIHPAEILATFHQFQEDHQDFSFFYTDGSRAEDRTGASFVFKKFSQSFRLSDFHSVYSAEVAAILAALQYIKNRSINKAIICSDSQSAIFALSSLHNSSHPTIDKIRRILSSIPNYQIKFLWIPGHTGIPGNDRADSAAKASLYDPPRNNIACPASDFLSTVHKKFKTYLQTQWNENPHFHLHAIKPNIASWATANQNTREKEIILARLRLGHTNTTHLFLITQTPPPTCTRCHTRYTIQHMLIDCPRYATARQPLIRHAAANRLPLTLPALLGDSNPDMIDLLFAFLHSTRLELFI
jgi:ribonuclease HI